MPGKWEREGRGERLRYRRVCEVGGWSAWEAAQGDRRGCGRQRVSDKTVEFNTLRVPRSFSWKVTGHATYVYQILSNHQCVQLLQASACSQEEKIHE